MNILVTINQNYTKQLNVLLNSIMYSNPNEKFDIYILYKNLTKQDFKVIKTGLNLEIFKIIPIKIPKNEIELYPVYQKRYPLEIYFRLFASKYLPENLDRVLYLDSDTLVINSLNELYNMDFENNLYIAATHIGKFLNKINKIRLNLKEEEQYINTGVLLMNLDKLRKIDIQKEVNKFVKENEKKMLLPDQDIICSLYGNKIKLIDELKYNLGERTWRLYNFNNPQKSISLKWICKNTVIIHYYGKNKPWKDEYIGKLNLFYKKIEKKIRKNKEKKVLILSCGTGGGHNSAALAVKESLERKNIKTDFIEYLDIINKRVKNHVNNLYIKSTNNNGKAFKVVYHLGELYQKTNLKSPVYALNSLNKKKIYNYIKNNQYDYVVTTHLYSAQVLTAIKKYYKLPFISIATDYVSIPFWEETNPDIFVIPSKDLESDFIKKGIKKEIIYPIGIPVSRAFSEEYNKEKCKKELGLNEDKKYILILTGSMGFGSAEQIVSKLVRDIEDVNYIVSCGNNISLYENLQNEYKNEKRVIPLPYTNKISEYMKCSDIILSKPGGLTTTEIATLNIPFIHTMPIPGCENYNAEFFSERKMSLKSNSVEEVVKNTNLLLKDKDLQKKMVENQKKYINRNACDEIADLIIKEMSK